MFLSRGVTSPQRVTVPVKTKTPNNKLKGFNDEIDLKFFFYFIMSLRAKKLTPTQTFNDL